MTDGQVYITWDDGHSPESEDDESEEDLGHEAEEYVELSEDEHSTRLHCSRISRRKQKRTVTHRSRFYSSVTFVWPLTFLITIVMLLQ